MAGIAQHHVWRMLQRGFSFTDKGPDQIWVYSRDTEPKQWVTKKFGRDDYFYGEPDVGADKNITEFENSVQGFVQEARNLEHGTRIDNETCASLLSHLEMRSQFLRDEMSRMGERAVEFIRGQVNSRRNFSKLAETYLRKHPEMLEAELEKADIDRSLWPALKELVSKGIPDAIESTRSEMRIIFEALFGGLLESLVEIAKKSHNKTLMSDFSEIERTEFHRQLEFSVFRTGPNELILPDTCVAFFMQDGCRPVSSKSDKIEAVFLPISASAAILGTKNQKLDRKVDTINRALASCAYKEFLSPVNSPELRRLAARISRNAKLISDAEMQSLFRIDSLLDSL